MGRAFRNVAGATARSPFAIVEAAAVRSGLLQDVVDRREALSLLRWTQHGGLDAEAAEAPEVPLRLSHLVYVLQRGAQFGALVTKSEEHMHATLEATTVPMRLAETSLLATAGERAEFEWGDRAGGHEVICVAAPAPDRKS
jgi:hypothetical protein